MAHRLGPIEICCDAPPYTVVVACRRLGVQFPEDVRWCRLSHHVSERAGWREMFMHHPWKTLLGINRPQEKGCVCGGKLPALERCTFTFNTGRQAAYLIGQCRRCHTVFWDAC